MSSSSTVTPAYSGVTRRDIHALELLIAGRADILKPIIRVSLVRPGNAKIVTGQDSKVGDAFDTFTVIKRNGMWTVGSSIVRDRVVVIAGH